MRRPMGTLLFATAAGAVILGIGGRLAMSAIAVIGGASPAYTVGGTLTVVALGAASGLAGGLIALLSAWSTRRLMPRHPWVRHLLFGALLLLVTLRGLRGAPRPAYPFFLPLVVAYGLVLTIWLSRRGSGDSGGSALSPGDQSQRPLPRVTE